MTSDSPAELVAIIRAARVAGDKRLERKARRVLKEEFGISLSFDREPEKCRESVANV